jgi:hypothetical protein
MSTYLDKIMSNHVFNSESSEDLAYLYSEEDYNRSYNMKGGAGTGAGANNEDRPTGGFPPIFILEDTREKEDEKVKNRQLTAITTSINIKDILKSKK